MKYGTFRYDTVEVENGLYQWLSLQRQWILTNKNAGKSIVTWEFTLTIRLRAWDLCEVIVDEGEARINYHLIEIESE